MVVAPAMFQETDPQLVAFANRLIQAKVENEDDEFWETDTELFKRAHRAIANRVRFAISGVEPLFTPDEIMVSFSPDLMVALPEGPGVPGYELQIDTLVPNPEVSETPNGSGDWIIRGFEPTEEGVKACIQSLLERGFVWDERLQAVCEDRAQVKSWVTDWMRSGAKGAVEAAAKQTAAESQVSFASFDRLESLDQFQTHLMHSESLALLFLPADLQVRDGFWLALHNVGKAYPAHLFLVPAGSELAIAFGQLKGPQQGPGWEAEIFVKGKRLSGALGEMMSDPYRRLAQGYEVPTGHPPRRPNLWR